MSCLVATSISSELNDSVFLKFVSTTEEMIVSEVIVSLKKYFFGGSTDNENILVFCSKHFYDIYNVLTTDGNV